jgi:sugar transferase (PEP-CTERM/EpsH1 system associated)
VAVKNIKEYVMAMDCIAHLTQSFGCGGLEKVIVNLINNSQHIPNTKHIVISLTDDIEMAKELPENVTVVSLSKKPGTDPLVYWRLIKTLRKHNVTIFHTYNFGTIEYHTAARLFGVKRQVHADHGMGGDDPHGRNQKHNMLRKWVSHLIHEYVVVSDDLKSWVVHAVGVNKNKVSFVFNGVNVPEKAPLVTKKEHALNLVIIGRLAPVKNHHRLFKAIRLASSSNPNVDIKCSVIGDGPEMENLKSVVESLNLDGKIDFLGLQMNIKPFLNEADGFILSSDYEAMPMTVLEAMAASRPVICPMVGGVTDFISKKEAILVEKHSEKALADGIIALAEMTQEERENLAYSGYDLVRCKYSMEKMVNAYFDIYKLRKK